VHCQDGAHALEEERHRRLTEAESYSSSIGRLERSFELLVEALKSASRREEGHSAMVALLKQVRDVCTHRSFSSCSIVLTHVPLAPYPSPTHAGTWRCPEPIRVLEGRAGSQRDAARARKWRNARHAAGTANPYA